MNMSGRDNVKTALSATLAFALLVGGGALAFGRGSKRNHGASVLKDEKSDDMTVTTAGEDSGDSSDEELDLSVIHCLRSRRSIFPRSYLKNPPRLDDSVVRSLLDAAMWGPFHGKNRAGTDHPARFVVLGPQAMVDMQKMTLDYYDKNWKEVGWGSGNVGGSQEDYDKWRTMTEEEITGRWAPCTHMIAIVMRRQSGPRRLPEWEEISAVAAAVQNMHVQSTKFPQLACYWSSWHEAVRDSDEMKKFLGMGSEDRCMGMFCIAQKEPKRVSEKDYRRRDRSIMQVEWRA
mmetsp:Transcript_19345/g.44990  ORF Transcript_19345/g.44990 Transcript_19345/m.44990 type:complete len:289 (+) Transcript_19345:67-933(+)|eukprot:CAMPEP_0197174056 /NCGR_PEP_ID=MMETSP1423-20130617/746_1 /TAXON_ID=476441 /ORGANISM="Pseudo-nitzschia heimii, Strain UNC1101" /LENGTH=288 /DNA_ID=CAMNT_0042622949 /DNA_START=44 /DNA_END=910 /DNA_ORIENTATION=-